jgi:predicted phosphodiesterase
MIFYAGDIHGRVDDVAAIDRAAIKAGVNTVVQVGDFGARWPGSPCAIYKYFEKRARRGRPGPTWYTCGGNHDNWDKWSLLAAQQGHPTLVQLAPACYFAQRGSLQDIEGIKHLFLGGAESIDRHVRTTGVSWWAAETPTHAEFCLFSERLENEKPEVVITHDAPLCVNIPRTDKRSKSTPRNLQNVLKLSEHKPARWYFGHYHILDSWKVEETTFFCCGLHGEVVKG